MADSEARLARLEAAFSGFEDSIRGMDAAEVVRLRGIIDRASAAIDPSLYLSLLADLSAVEDHLAGKYLFLEIGGRRIHMADVVKEAREAIIKARSILVDGKGKGAGRG